jgi:hypothetical protein
VGYSPRRTTGKEKPLFDCDLDPVGGKRRERQLLRNIRFRDELSDWQLAGCS